MEQLREKNELVLYRKRREPSLAVVKSKNTSCTTIINEEGKQTSIDTGKIIYRTGITMENTDDINELRKQFRKLRVNLSRGIEDTDIKALWEAVRDVNRELDFSELLELYEGKKKLSEEEKLQLFWAIDKDRSFFRRNKNGYIPNSRNDVNRAILRKERDRLRQEEEGKAVEWVLSVLSQGKGKQDAYGFDADHYIGLIKDYVTADHSYPVSRDSKRFISETGIRTQEQAIEFLRKIGECGQDDDPVSLKLKVFESYRSGVEKQVDRILSEDYSLDNIELYESSPVYSIDDKTTRDIDDAIAYMKMDEGHEVAIHITDVGFFIEKNSDLDKEALIRGESVYLPEKTINMLPPDLVHKKLSLFEGSEKPVLSLIARFDPEYNVTEYRFEKLKVIIDKNLSYLHTEKIFSEDPWAVELKKLAFALRQKRINNNAFLLQLPDLKFDIDDKGMPSMLKNNMDTVPHIVVSELMIMINHLAAKMLKKNAIPCIYRTQVDEVDDEARELDSSDPLYPVKILKYLNPSRLSLEPARHSSLGLDCYTQISSPIRRYLDIVMQRQIIKYIESEKICYTAQELQNVIDRVGTGMPDRRYAQKSRKRYWVFKYLKNNESELTGYVSSVSDKKVNIYFPDILMDLPVSNPGADLNEGDKVLMQIKNIDPLKKKINLKFKCKLNNDSQL